MFTGIPSRNMFVLKIAMTLLAFVHFNYADAQTDSGADMSLCVSAGRNCANGSTCAYLDGGSDIDHANDGASSEVYCLCSDDWAGLTCETPQTQCGNSNIFCYNNGTCKEKPTSGGSGQRITEYECQCATPSSINGIFVGENCEYRASPCSSGSSNQEDIFDTRSYCVAPQGSCVDDSNGNFIGCYCQQGYTGDHCQLKGGFDATTDDVNNINDESEDGSVSETVIVIASVLSCVAALVLLLLVYKIKSRRSKEHDDTIDLGMKKTHGNVTTETETEIV